MSVVTPAFNASKYLGQLLESVRAQQYPRIEHIVIDDGSTDAGETQAVLRRHPGVRWWSRENRGQYATLNEGFIAATGDLVTTISADDFYVDSRAVSDVVDAYLRSEDCDVLYGDTLHVDSVGIPLPVQPYQAFPLWMTPYNPGFISHCSLFVRRDRLIADRLLFDESLRFIGDGDWMIRLYRAGYRHRRVNRAIAAYRHHPQQVSTIVAVDPTGAAQRAAERNRVDSRYVRSRLVKRLVGAYVTYLRRRGIAVHALKRGGVLSLFRLFRKKWGNHVPTKRVDP